MHPLKPYFLGTERPPHPRVTTCQKTFRTADIEIIGTTTRHLTFFEMLGNFSFGDYFKREAVALRLGPLARRASASTRTTSGSPCSPATTSSGSGPTRRRSRRGSRSACRASGSSSARALRTSGRPARPGPAARARSCTSTAASTFGKPDDLPGGDNERFLEYWNLVFMQFDQNPPNKLTPLPAKNIDTGLGLNRLAAILQDKETVFETDQFAPLIALGEELSGRRYGAGFQTDRALRILADHGRAMTFLIADGVVPSNEDRGYVLRRIMRRAILQGRTRSGSIRASWLRYSDLVTELMGAEYPRAARAARVDPQVARAPRRRASAARSTQGMRAARRADRARRGGRAPRGSPPPTRSCSTTPTASRSI